MVRRAIDEIENNEYAESNEAEIDMSLNENPIGASGKAVSAVQSIKPEKIYRYQHHDCLREKVSEFLNVEPKNLLLANGCDGALEIIAQTYFEQGVEVAIPVPSFPRYTTHVRKMNAETEEIKGEDLHPSPERLSEIDADFMILANPQNPTGEKFSIQELKQLKQNFTGHIILDEALVHLNSGHTNLVDQNFTVAGSFSKLFGLAGLRAGYIVSDNSRKLRKASSPFKMNSAAQEAVKSVLDHKDYLKQTYDTLKEELRFLKDSLSDLGLDYSDSASLTMLIDFSNQEISARQVHGELMERGVKVVKGSHFEGLENGRYIRISVRDRKTNLEFIRALAEVLGKDLRTINKLQGGRNEYGR